MRLMTLKGPVTMDKVTAIRCTRDTRADGKSRHAGETYEVPGDISEVAAMTLIKIGKAEAAVEGVGKLPGPPKADLTEEERLERITEAISGLDLENPDTVTTAGAPKVDVLSSITGLDVSADERDVSWELFVEARDKASKEKNEGGNDGPNKTQEG